MQQYFTDYKVNINDVIPLDDDIVFHLKKVLRKDSSYQFRIVDSDAKVYLAHLQNDGCHIDEYLDQNNELDIDITCIMSLIKMDKFELCIQKLVELGVKHIVPYQAIRSVVRIKDNKKLDRLRKIIKEAAEQSHRNIVPELHDVIDLDSISNYLSKNNYIAYENQKGNYDISVDGSVTFIIGPEGGFTENEYQSIVDLGFKSISLGKRILRAETAAIYLSSIIVGKCQ